MLHDRLVPCPGSSAAAGVPNTARANTKKQEMADLTRLWGEIEAVLKATAHPVMTVSDVCCAFAEPLAAGGPTARSLRRSPPLAAAANPPPQHNTKKTKKTKK